MGVEMPAPTSPPAVAPTDTQSTSEQTSLPTPLVSMQSDALATTSGIEEDQTIVLETLTIADTDPDVLPVTSKTSIETGLVGPPVTSEASAVALRTGTSNTSVTVLATPFMVFYDTLSNEIPTEEDMNLVADLTLEYLEKYLVSLNVSDSFKFVGFPLGTSLTPVPMAEYTVDLILYQSSDNIPTQQRLDDHIESAFTQPTVRNFIASLQKVSPLNPISKTWTVTYSSKAQAMLVEDIEQTTTKLSTASSHSSGNSSMANTKHSGGLFGLVFIAIVLLGFLIGLIAHRLEKKRKMKKEWGVPGVIGVENQMVMPGKTNVMAFMDREMDRGSRLVYHADLLQSQEGGGSEKEDLGKGLIFEQEEAEDRFIKQDDDDETGLIFGKAKLGDGVDL